MAGRLRAHVRQHAVGYLALFVALGGTAFAANSLVGEDGSITGCVKKTNGKVRVVAEGKKCPSGYRKLVWSQEGPQGVPGEKGEQGLQGIQGQKGDPGGSIVARARATGLPVDVAGAPGATTIQLTGGDWTQAPDELDMPFAVATAEVHGGSCPGDAVVVKIYENGGEIGQGTAVASPVPAPVAIEFGLFVTKFGYFFEPGVATNRSLTVKAFHNCTGGAVATVHSVKVDIVGLK